MGKKPGNSWERGGQDSDPKGTPGIPGWSQGLAVGMDDPGGSQKVLGFHSMGSGSREQIQELGQGRDLSRGREHPEAQGGARRG